MGRDFSSRVGGYRVSLGISRPRETLADRRFADPEIGNAEIPNFLL